MIYFRLQVMKKTAMAAYTFDDKVYNGQLLCEIDQKSKRKFGQILNKDIDLIFQFDEK